MKEPTAMAEVSGVNLIGDLTVESGLGEATTKTLDAMLEVDIPVAYRELPYHLDKRGALLPARFAALPRDADYPTNLLFYNINEMHTLSDDELAAMTRGRYTVAAWAWELTKVPTFYMPEFGRVDEIWVPSRYSQQFLAQVSRTPVTVVPYPIDLSPSKEITRGHFGIPDHRFTFLFTFAATSCESRKNPFAVVDAFQRAFGQTDEGGPLLVLKAHHIEKYPLLRRALRAAVARAGGILLEDSYSREQMDSLLDCADCYVSLHRAEAFGLGMAESMYLGKPVIGTAYSGNLDFMTSENSYLVDCQLRQIDSRDHTYQPECANVYEHGYEWAEPDVDQAAAYMRQIYEHPEDARARGQRAAADMRSQLSKAAVGQLIAERLAAIQHEQPSRNRARRPQRLQPAEPQPTRAGATVTSETPNMPGGDELEVLRAQTSTTISRHFSYLQAWDSVRTRDQRVPLGSVPILGAMTRIIVRILLLGRLGIQQFWLNRVAYDEFQLIVGQLTALQDAIWDFEGRYARREQVEAERLNESLDALRREGDERAAEVLQVLRREGDERAAEVLQVLRREGDERAAEVLQVLRREGDERAAEVLQVLRHEFQESIAKSVVAIEMDYADRTDALTVADHEIRRRLDAVSGDVDQIYGQQDALMAQLHDAGERIRLNTGLIRLLDQQAIPSSTRPESEPGPMVSGNGLLATIRAIEQALPDAAHARCVALSIQDCGVEDVLLAGAAYLRERLDTWGDGTTNDLWYHVDFTRDQNLSILLENARSKLEPGGHLVLITDASVDIAEYAEYAGLEYVLSRLAAIASSGPVHAHIWRRPANPPRPQVPDHVATLAHDGAALNGHHPGQTGRTIVCTLVSKNYLSIARTLTRSVLEQHPNLQVVTCLVDEIDGYFDPAAEPFETIRAAELKIPGWRHFAMKYSIMELNTAVKPYLLEHLLNRHGVDNVIYFDPDIIVYGKLDELIALLDRHTVVLTPHLLDPLRDDYHLNEVDILRCGTFNLGFIALARRGHWRELLRWWQSKLYTGCIVDFERGYFVDQRWMDFAPSLFEGVYVLRHPGYNVAYWNIQTRDLRTSPAGYVVNGKPLVFFHFSGYNFAEPDTVSKYQDRYVMAHLKQAYRACFADYRERVLANGHTDTKDWPYAYATFSDGVPISDLARRCLLGEDPRGERWPDPFDVTGDDNFRRWLTHPTPARGSPLVSPYVLAAYKAHPGLQRVLGDPTDGGGEALARWVVGQADDADSDHVLFHPVYVEPIRQAVARAEAPVTEQGFSPPQAAGFQPKR